MAPYELSSHIVFDMMYEAGKGPFTKDVQLTPREGGLRNPDVQLLFECDSIVLFGRRGEGVLEILVLAGRPLCMAHTNFVK